MKEPKPAQPDSDDPDLEEFERVRDMLHAHISDLAEEHDLPVGALSPMLIDLAVTTRMMDYVLSVEKPSGGGLKRDLDRMQREFDHFVRDCKRRADEFIDYSKNALQEMQAEQEAEGHLEAEDDDPDQDQETTRKP